MKNNILTFLSPDQASFPAWTFFFFCIREEDAEMLKVHQRKKKYYINTTKQRKETKIYSTQCGNSTE